MKGTKSMTHELQAGLHAAALRQTASDRTWVGYWLKRHQDHDRLDAAQLASNLGLTMDSFVLLALCRTPRADHFQNDVAAICQRTGVREIDLVRLLRQEQNIEKLQQAGPASQRGWLMAASDRPPDSGEPPPTPEDSP